MICTNPTCDSNKSSVSDKRDREDGSFRRRRKCLVCGTTWSTREAIHDFRSGVGIDESQLRETLLNDLSKVLLPILETSK